MSRKPCVAISFTLALAVLFTFLNPGVAFAEDPLPGNVLVKGRVMDNDGDPMANRRVTFTLINLSTEVQTWVGECVTNSLGNYQFPLFYIQGYLGTHDICLQAGGDPVRYSARDGVLVHEFLIVNHGTINIHFVDAAQDPVGAGVPFWLLSKRPGDPHDPGWPDDYVLDGDLERTTDSSGTISVFTDKGYVYRYDQSGSKRYIWDDSDGVSLAPEVGATKDITIEIRPLGKVSFEAYTPESDLAVGLDYSYPSSGSGTRFVVDEGDGRLSLYFPAPGPARISGTMPGNPLTGNMGYTLPQTSVNIVAWGEATASGTLVEKEPGEVGGTIYWVPGYDLVEGATVQLWWRPNISSPLTLLHETTTDTSGEFSFGDVVPSEIPYTVRASKDAVGGVLGSTYTADVSSGSRSSVDLYMIQDSAPPAAPSGLTVTDPADASGLNLSWNASSESDLAGYSVYRSAAEAGEYTVVAADLTTNTYKDTTAAVGQEYWYSITASDRAGNESVRSTPSHATLTGTVISFANATFSTIEGSSCVVNLTRSGDASGVATIECATHDGSAVSGQDYVAKTGTITFAAEQTSASFTVEFVDDADHEGNETLTVQLSNPGGGAIPGAPSTATLTIEDNDFDLPDTTILSLSSGDYVGDDAAITGSASGGAGIDRVEICLTRSDNLSWSGTEWIEAETWLAASGAGSWTFDLTGAGLFAEEGDYDVKARAVDSLGQADPSPAEVPFTYDMHSPTLQVDTPASGAHLTGNQPQVIALASDSCSGVSSVEFKYSANGSTWTAISTDNTVVDGYTAVWGDSRLPEGAVTLRVTVTDLTGRSTSVDVALTVDTVSPGDDPGPEPEPEDEPAPPAREPASEPAPLESIVGTSAPDSDVELSNPAAGMTLSIPSGATDAAVEFSVAALPTEEAATLLDTADTPDGFATVGPVFQFSAVEVDSSEPVTSFREPLVFRLDLSSEDLTKMKDPRKIGLYRLNDDGSLTFVGGRVIGNKLVVEMYGFSRYLIGENPATFGDVQGHWAQDEIELMASRWVVRGRDSGLFDPDTIISRAEFAMMLSRAMLLRPTRTDPGFADVTSSDFCYGELATAVDAGLVSGYRDGTFRPNDPVIREETCAMIARALRLGGAALADADVAGVLSSFADIGQVSDWARTDVALCIEQGIVEEIEGVDEDMLAPLANVTRAEAAVTIARFWDR